MQRSASKSRSAASTTRFEGAPVARIGGVEVPVAVGIRARLLGLSGLDLRSAGPGLLIPRCSSVHTFGMRFRLDVLFLDGEGKVLSARLGVGRRRIASHPGAEAVLELPSASGESRNLRCEGGESRSLRI
jgi:hypothetical protein